MEEPAEMSGVAFVDTETTGLDPDRHEIWEVGLMVDDREYQWFLPVDLGRADSFALKVGGFHERYRLDRFSTNLTVFSARFAELTRGRHLVGAVVSFDEERLRKLLRANGACPEWHYHLIDVEALMVGYLACEGGSLSPPWKSESLSLSIGVNPEDFDRHTALGDARWAKAIYEKVMAE